MPRGITRHERRRALHGGMRVVDVHVHLAPERLARAVRRALHEMYGWTLEGTLDPDAVAAEVRAAGADLMVSLPYAHVPGIAASLNRHGLDLAAAHRDVLTMATVHPDDDDPPGLLENALAAGAVGLKVHCPVQRTAPDDPRMARVYDLCEAEGVPVLMHAGHGPDEHTPHSGAAPFAALMRRHPRLRVCVAHLGFPETGAFLDLLDGHPNLYLDVSSVAGGGFQAPGLPLERVRAATPRLLWGSDHPNSPTDVAAGLRALRELGIDGDELAAVLAGNAETFLGAPARR